MPKNFSIGRFHLQELPPPRMIHRGDYDPDDIRGHVDCSTRLELNVSDQFHRIEMSGEEFRELRRFFRSFEAAAEIHTGGQVIAVPGR